MANNPIFDKHQEDPTPEHVIVHDNQVKMDRYQFQAFLKRLEYFNSQGITFELYGDQVLFGIPDGLPEGVETLIKQFEAKTVWMALLRTTLEEAMGHKIVGDTSG